ncbi:MAG TPA: tetratricopeptide repeat protein, partial [Pyrinomonadaceae bacterium]|nr:tetratricopeptide repeat protein [Pyrinomonadaceae bacterium]
RAGDTKQTLRVLHRIADLDPNNTDIRIKLAEGYLKEGMQADAAKTFAEAAGRMLETGAFEQSLDAYSKALELRPNDRATLKGLVSAHAALGTAEDAAELLEEVVAANPDDTDLISMLADAYIEAADPVGAERGVRLLMAQDASNYRRYIEVAGLYLKVGNENESARVLGTIIEPMLAGREENDLLQLVDDLLARDPEHVASLRLLVRIHWWQRDMEKLRSTLERLAGSAEAAGLDEDERYALTQLVRLTPEEPRYLERLNALGGVLEDETENAPIIDDSTPAGVPSFENFAILEDNAMPVPAESESWQAGEGGQADEFEWNSVAGEKPVDTGAADAGAADSGVSFADLNEADEPSEPDVEITFASSPAAAEPAFHEFEFNTTIDETPVEELNPDGESTVARIRSMMDQELESVDFYIAQGYSDIAADTLELLERQFGSHPEIDSRRERLLAERQGGGVAVAQSDVETDTELKFVVEEEPDGQGDVVPETLPSAPAPTGIDAGLAEIFEEFRVEAEGEHVSTNADYETHYNTATAYKEMALLDEAIREFQTAAGLTAPTDGTSRYFQCCNMLGHCFVQKGMPQAAVLWFKKGIDAPGRTAEEYKALQYELGSAYEEMGDFKRAINVFTEVYGVDVGYRDIADKLSDLQDRVSADKSKEKDEDR